jgi:hypothetical protein
MTRNPWAQFPVDFYRENGPSVVAGAHLHPSDSLRMDGYLALLIGQNVPHAKPTRLRQREGNLMEPLQPGRWKRARPGCEAVSGRHPQIAEEIA